MNTEATMNETRRAFAMGWEAGRRRGEATPRQCERLLRGLLRRQPSTAEVDAFGQGTVDGEAGDPWRLERSRGH